MLSTSHVFVAQSQVDVSTAQKSFHLNGLSRTIGFNKVPDRKKYDAADSDFLFKAPFLDCMTNYNGNVFLAARHSWYSDLANQLLHCNSNFENNRCEGNNNRGSSG